MLTVRSHLPFTLPDNTKVAGDISGNYSLPNSVGFTRDSVEKITLRDESYPRKKISFGHKNIDN